MAGGHRRPRCEGQDMSAATGWESRYRALEEAAVALRDERDDLRADIAYLRDYFKSTWNIDKILCRYQMGHAARSAAASAGADYDVSDVREAAVTAARVQELEAEVKRLQAGFDASQEQLAKLIGQRAGMRHALEQIESEAFTSERQVLRRIAAEALS